MANSDPQLFVSASLLHGNGVVLRPLRASDAQDLYETCQDAEIVEYTTIPVPYLMSHAADFIADPPKFTWAITLQEFGDRYCGSIELRLSAGDYPVNLGYMTAP
ncbi:GNAT family N-acetyltransferase [Canibacter sp. lx-45]|uniref:GNAT family N-acetyltransferase n=1 Tax=Canibacter zhuwentaonis TaxID=2837491 RepID=UPI001BDC06D8|nr:GNAT family N-acetyltransferase [Canibacter zhuwentaonis]MBT1035956.1 GNAT family N-acetyltransferase [Canibacter zhuwentaonis]